MMRKESSKSSTPDSECNDLHEDLSNKGWADSPLCRCCDKIEDAKAYLIHCTNYQELWDKLTCALYFNISEYYIDILLHGDRNLGTGGNRNILKLSNVWSKSQNDSIRHTNCIHQWNTI